MQTGSDKVSVAEIGMAGEGEINRDDEQEEDYGEEGEENQDNEEGQATRTGGRNAKQK